MSADNATPRELVEIVYASTIDPDRYDELISVWQRHLDTVLAEADPDAMGPLDTAATPDEIERHFERAFAILERFGRSGTELRSLDALVEGEARPALLLDTAGRIVAANGRAQELFGIGAGATVSILNFEATGLSHVRQALESLQAEPEGRLLTVTRVMLPQDGSTPLVALSRAASVEGGRPLAILSIADIAWSDRIGDLLRQVFGLTAAECEITRAIIAGQSIEDIARLRDRSEATIRTQAKAVLRKLDLRTQAELVRMVAALMQMDAGPRGLRPSDDWPSGARSTLSLPDGRAMDVVTVGPPAGRPVLFIHGMLDGHGTTATLREGLIRRGIRLICPVRPCFGNSDPQEGPVSEAPARFAADLAAVIAHFRLPPCPVIGHMAGSVYAFAAAARLGARITAIVGISGGVPILSTAQFAAMNPRQRIMAYTARFTPRLLPLILRAGIAQLDSGGDRAFIDALYRHAPVDHAHTRSPEIFAQMREGYRFTVAQGHRAFEIDSWQVVRDWSAHVIGSTQPVLLIHGRHDPVVAIDSVRAFARRLGPRAELAEFEDQGQLLFYSAPDRVLDLLDAVEARQDHRRA